jgi:hypothetical protein
MLMHDTLMLAGYWLTTDRAKYLNCGRTSLYFLLLQKHTFEFSMAQWLKVSAIHKRFTFDMPLTKTVIICVRCVHFEEECMWVTCAMSTRTDHCLFNSTIVRGVHCVRARVRVCI